MKKIFNKLFPKKFKPYWDRNKNTGKFDDTLKFITENFVNSDSYKFVSNQWHLLNINDFESLKKNGLNKYGSEISTHYFTFLDYNEEHIKNLFKIINNKNNVSYQTNVFKKHSNLDHKTSLIYNLLCLLLYENLKHSKCLEHLSKLSDKTYCNHDHPFINIDDQKITSDKIISLFDFENIDNFCKLNDQNNILEIGAGSGRLCECLLSINQKLKYTICDIPPSIYIAYERVKIRFPEKKIELLFNIENPEQIIKKINENDISFIFPHQLKIVKKFYFDLTIAVDCFHEMDKKTLNYYFYNLNNVTKNFYFSIWKKTKNWGSGGLFKKTENLDFDKGDYNIPDNWQKKFRENLKFPSNQIGIGYKIIE
jgi:putative sugar O-methyltransferase